MPSLLKKGSLGGIFSSQDNPNEDGEKKKSTLNELSQAKTLEDAKKYIGYVQKLGTGWVVVIIVAVAVIILMQPGTPAKALNGGSGSTTAPTGAPVVTIPGLNLKLTGPIKLNNGDLLQYTIDVTYTGTTPPLSSIVVYEVIPPNTVFADASGAYTYENGQLMWPMSQNENAFTFTLKPTTPDIEIKNQVYAKLLPGSSTGGENVPPTYSDCGNSSYAMQMEKNPDKSNFGDPECNFNEAVLYETLKKEDPLNADFWYKCALLESSYIPVAYAPPSTGTPDSGGAWGLYQMGRGKNGPTDHGDVNWPNQIVNAVGHSRLTNSFKDYWQCARDLDYDGIQ